MTDFRVFFADGSALDIRAATPQAARNIARDRRSSAILKVKVIKESDDA